MKRFLSLLAMGVLQAYAQAVPGVVASEPTVDVKNLTEVVLRYNPRHLAVLQAERQAQAGVITAGALPNPRLEVGQGSAQPRSSGAVQGTVTTMGLTQPIENPSVRNSRVGSAVSLQNWAQQQVRLSRLQLIAEVEALAYEYFWRRDTARVYREDWQLLEQVRERVRVKVDSGEAARYELIKADAEVINARQRFQSAEVLAQQVLLSFNRLAAGQLPGLSDIQGALDQVVDMNSLVNLQEQAEQRNPELAALRALLVRARQQLELAQAQRWPGAELRYQQTQDPQIRQDVWGVQVQIPLLDQRRGPVAEAQAEVARLQTLVDGRTAELKQQMLQSWKALEIARNKVSALSTGAVRVAETALQVAQSAYRFGERGILDVLDAQRVLQSVRVDLLQARFELQKARIDLELLSAQRIEL